ncbi:MAG TPA: DUF3822 family protein [Flavobacteriaceae bacterium]|nr:DUF3822 family protein [Flavobacteriaceae bacterium]
MVKQNSNTHLPTLKKLSIQIGLSGLSFSILEVNTHTLLKLKQFKKDRTLNPFEILDYLKFIIDTEQLANHTYEQVTVIYRNDLVTLVPDAFFDEDSLAEYLKFNNKILATDFIAFDKINDTAVVYVPLVNVNNFLFDTFGSFTYKHFATQFIEYITSQNEATEEPVVTIHVEENVFEMLITKNKDIQFYNTFAFTTPEDFIYYILFTLEQMQYNPEAILLHFYGTLTPTSDLYAIAYKYIRNVEIKTNSFSFVNPNEIQIPESSNLALLSSFLCE